MTEIWTPPTAGEDCHKLGEETREVSHRLTDEQCLYRADDATAKEEAAAKEVARAKAALKVAQAEQKEALAEVARLRFESQHRAEVKSALLAKFHDYRDKSYPTGRLVYVRVNGSQAGEVVQELSRPLQANEGRQVQPELQLPEPGPAVAGEVGEQLAVVAEAMMAALDAAGIDGMDIGVLADRVEQETGVDVEEDALRLLVEQSPSWTMDGDGDHVMLKLEPAVKPDTAAAHIGVRAKKLLRDRDGKSTTVATLIKNWKEGWGEPPSKEQIAEALDKNEYHDVEKTARGYRYTGGQ